MDGTDIKIGTKLELEVSEYEGSSSPIACVSQLIEVIDANSLIIANPIYESKYVMARQGSSTKVIFYDPKKGMLTFPGLITGRTKDKNVLALQMSITGAIVKIQRRNFYRLDHILFAKYRIPGNEEAKQAITKNLSGSGICISTYEKIEKGEELELSITLDNDIQLKSLCHVVRCEETGQPVQKRFDIGMRFTKISPQDREAIVKYVFEKQRLMLNR